MDVSDGARRAVWTGVMVLAGTTATATATTGEGRLEASIAGPTVPMTAPLTYEDGALPELLGDAGLAAFQDGDGEALDGSWKRRFTLAFSGSFGNTDTQAGNAGFNAERETVDDRTTADARWYYGVNNGDETENRLTAGVRQDWFVPDTRWLYFVQGRYDYDSYQSWSQRVSGHGGVGYHLVDREHYDLTLRAGGGVLKEWGSEDQDLKIEGLLGADVEWHPTDKQTFTFSTTFYPDLSDFGEYRWVTSADWSVLVDEEANMSLAAGLYHEYQSEVDPGQSNYDLKIYAGLQFDF